MFMAQWSSSVIKPPLRDLKDQNSFQSKTLFVIFIVILSKVCNGAVQMLRVMGAIKKTEWYTEYNPAIFMKPDILKFAKM